MRWSCGGGRAKQKMTRLQVLAMHPVFIGQLAVGVLLLATRSAASTQPVALSPHEHFRLKDLFFQLFFPSFLCVCSYCNKLN